MTSPTLPTPSVKLRPLALLLTLVAPVLLGTSAAAGDADVVAVPIPGWLVLGPLDDAPPAFAEEGVAALEEGSPLPVGELWPAAGDAVPWPSGEVAWEERAGLELPAAGGGHRLYAALYLEARRFLEPEIELRSRHPLRLYLDGEEVAKKGSTEVDGEPGELSATLELGQGEHLLLVEAVRDPRVSGTEPADAGTIAAEVTLPADRAGALSASLSPRHRLRISDLLDVSSIGGVHAAPDGAHAAVELQRPAVPAEDRESWVEIRRTADGTVVRELPGASGFAWAPDGRFSYTTRDGDGAATLWLASLGTGGRRPIVEDVAGFGGYLWSPDGRSVIYSASEKSEPDERGVKRYRGLTDRWTGWRDRSHLHQVLVDGGVRRRLTAGRVGDSLQDVRPDGRRVLFTRTRWETTERPFYTTELYELDLATLEPRLIREAGWLDSASYSPDGRRLLVRGGATLFGGVGKSTAAAVFSNEYDSQLFLLDLDGEDVDGEGAGGEVDPVTRDYDPAVLDAAWSRHDGLVYLRVQERSWSRIVRYDPAARSFEQLDAGVDVVEEMSLARDAPVVVYHGSSAATPPRVLTRRTGGGEPAVVAFPAEERYARIELGKVEEWSFPAADGTEILGRVHYPPGFDPEERYPLIVFYYGGAAPVDRAFGGRYPKNLWAASGYVVYVLQPSGAPGFGQEMAARHVNDWGRRAGSEILDGVERFLDQHPFVDRDRVGALGASYGGFMTLHLLTESDLFATAISHAGISNLASYWGEGWWGYLYSAVASAESYPWNARELYVEQSPLFDADEIHTPLLLLHGDADTNVPPGESQQMYTALKLLGREVELIEIGGENHQIFTYPKRELWMRTILAWFDRHLKDQPELWRNLWGTDDEPRG